MNIITLGLRRRSCEWQVQTPKSGTDRKGRRDVVVTIEDDEWAGVGQEDPKELGPTPDSDINVVGGWCYFEMKMTIFSMPFLFSGWVRNRGWNWKKSQEPAPPWHIK